MAENPLGTTTRRAFIGAAGAAATAATLNGATERQPGRFSRSAPTPGRLDKAGGNGNSKGRLFQA